MGPSARINLCRKTILQLYAGCLMDQGRGACQYINPRNKSLLLYKYLHNIPEMNFYQPMGFLVFGSRMRRLSETFLAETNKAYQDLDLNFEASWFPLFYLVAREQPVAISAIAARLEISHSAVSQLTGVLKNKGLINSVRSTADERSQLLHLSEAGRTLLEQLIPVWMAVSQAMEEIAGRNEDSAVLLAALTAFENSLQHGNLHELIEENYKRIGKSGLKPLITSL